MRNRRLDLVRALAIGATASLAFAAVAIAGVPRSAFVSRPTAAIAGVADYTSLAVDAMGRAHVVYADRSRDALVYAFQTESGWRSEQVDADGVGGWYASMVLDSRGAARVAYYDVALGVLKYATRSGGAWSTQVVDGTSNNVGHYCSLALDANDQPSISYYDARNLSLRFAKLVDGEWQIETVEGEGNAAETESALNRADRSSTAPELSEEVPNVGHYTSLAIDRAGVPHISYQDITNADLKVAVRPYGSWTTETVDSRGDVGEHSSLQVDAAGNAHVSYYDLQNGTLKYASQKAGRWTVETVDASGDVGAYASLELDEQGVPHIAYMDAANLALKYATMQDGGWRMETLDARDAAGRNVSLVLDRAGNPLIAYTASGGKGAFRLMSASGQFGGRPAGNNAPVATARSLAAWPLPYKGGALSISLVIPARGGHAQISLIDLAGRHVRTLQDGVLEAGQNVLSWDGRDDGGRNVANGVYFLSSRMAGQESKLKLVVLR